MARSLTRRGSRRNNGPGHNSAGMIDSTSLKRDVDRIITLMKDRKALNNDMKEIYEKLKDAGHVTRQVRQLVREAMMDQSILQEHLEGMDSLRHAIGILRGTPLGDAAEQAAASL